MTRTKGKPQRHVDTEEHGEEKSNLFLCASVSPCLDFIISWTMKNATVAYQNKDFARPIEYTFNLILSVLGIEHQIHQYSQTPAQTDSELLISYGNEKIKTKAKRHIHIYQSKLFGESYRTHASMPELPLERWNDLPVIYKGRSDLRELVVLNNRSVETNIDLIASSFFMVSRYEEIVVDEKDQYDRFPAAANVAYQEGFLTRPIVNEYIDLLWGWVDSFNLGFKRGTLWNGKHFAVLLTHDVDRIKKYRWWRPPLKSFARTIKRGQLGKTLHYAWDWIASSLRIKSDPYWNFDQVTELEHKYGFRSPFYFLIGGNTKYDRYRCSVNNPKIIALIKRLESMRHEIGLHGSFNSSNDYEIFVSEKAKLDQIVSNKQYGVRQHYLRWKTPDTWRILEKAGILYDTTLGYADREGFKCGICLPYKPFDVTKDRKINIWELPLIVMDASLYGYQNLSPEDAFQRIKRLINIVKKYNGVFVLLVHNPSLYELEYPEWSGLYEKVLAYMSDQLVFNGSAREIINWWQDYITRTKD